MVPWRTTAAEHDAYFFNLRSSLLTLGCRSELRLLLLNRNLPTDSRTVVLSTHYTAHQGNCK